MRQRISVFLGAAMITAGCTGMEADTRTAEQPYTAQTREATVYPLPGVKIAGERKRNLSFKTLHSLGVCSQKKCHLNVHIERDCTAPDLDPQALGLDHTIDEFELTYELWVPPGSQFVLMGLMEKGHSHGNPRDLFSQQSGAGTRTIVATVRNHFDHTRQYVIEIGKQGGQPCAVLDPPVMPDY